MFFYKHNLYRKNPKPKITNNEKAGKKPRVWGYGDPNLDVNSLDRSKDKSEDAPTNFSPDTEVGGVSLF